MNNWFKKRRIVILHPFLLSLYVLASILSVTILELPIRQSVPAFLLALITPSSFLLIFYKITKDWHRSGLLSSIIIFFLFYYGSVYRTLQSYGISRLSVSLNTILFPLWCLGFGLFFLASLRLKIRKKRLITTYLNVVSILVLANPLFILFQGFPRIINDPMQNWRPEMFGSINEVSDLKNPLTYSPDIYYIILDGYGRKDVLKDIYHFDNTEFTNYLREQGFYVADKSKTNYLKTAHSLASSLNLNYLEDLNQFEDRSGREASNPQPIRTLISRNELSKILNNFSYKTIAYDTGFSYTKLQNADIYFKSYLQISEFSELFLSFTIATLLNDYPENRIPLLTYNTHRSRIQFLLDRLKETPEIPGPKFVFVHLVLPHPPFVFDSEGKPVTPSRSFSLSDAEAFKGTLEEYQDGYIEQVLYVNKQLEEIIPILLEKSNSPPVIIIQGDHGPRRLVQWKSPEDSCLWEAASILNAYYFPDGDYSQLYDSISPVNSFRVVLNKYFLGNLPLLTDKTYFPNFLLPYDFVDITETADIPCNEKE